MICFTIPLAHTTQRVLAVIFFILNINGCAGSSVLFNEEDSGEYQETIYRVYFDREGHVYHNRNGENTAKIKTSEFDNGPGKGYLKRYFCKRPEELETVAKQTDIKFQKYECALKEEAKEGLSGAINYGVSLAQDKWLDQWVHIQESLLDRQSKSIAKLLKREDNIDRPLFVLIHGYNNDTKSIRETYVKARSILRSTYPKMKFVFLDVYWDGGEQLVPTTIWAPAQYVGPLVGVRMRKLLKEIEPKRSVRILTHSSGAFVAGNLIGDGRKAITKWKGDNVCTKGHKYYDQAYCRYKHITTSPDVSNETAEYLRDYEIIKSEDVRVGMIAPATSSWTFTGGDTSGLKHGRGLLKPSGTLRVLVGQHEDDFANTKLFGLECEKGVTTLGIRKSSFCEIQRHVKNNAILNGKVDVHRIDFKSDGKEPFTKAGFRAEHGLKYYLKRKKGPAFLSMLLDTDPILRTEQYINDNDCTKIIDIACEFVEDEPF